MRLTPLAVAALVALAALGPRAARAGDGAPTTDAALASTPVDPVPTGAPLAAPPGFASAATQPDLDAAERLTVEQATAQAAAADADARAAAAAGMRPPEASVRAGAEARGALAAHANPWYPKLGVAIGGGFPDLASASLLFRPISHVRFFAGPMWGYVGWGVQGGVVLVPWNAWIAPTISLEGGKLFRSDVTFLAKDKGGVPEGIEPLLRNIDYQYAAVDLGLELGSPRGLASYVRVGLSYVSLKANGTATYTSDTGSKVSLSDPSFHGTLPSVKFGLQYWF